MRDRLSIDKGEKMAKSDRSCVECGCKRKLTIVATVEDNVSETDYGMRRLCLPCLLKMAHYTASAPTADEIAALYATTD
jgi:hypothetical protein